MSITTINTLNDNILDILIENEHRLIIGLQDERNKLESKSTDQINTVEIENIHNLIQQSRTDKHNLERGKVINKAKKLFTENQRKKEIYKRVTANNSKNHLIKSVLTAQK